MMQDEIIRPEDQERQSATVNLGPTSSVHLFLAINWIPSCIRQCFFLLTVNLTGIRFEAGFFSTHLIPQVALEVCPVYQQTYRCKAHFYYALL